MDQELFDNLRLELRRGSLVIAVLSELRREQYGYELRKTLSDHGMVVEENTLYPLLRRLESQGLLASQWRMEEKRNKRFYVLTAKGQEMLDRLRAEWAEINTSLRQILK